MRPKGGSPLTPPSMGQGPHTGTGPLCPAAVAVALPVPFSVWLCWFLCGCCSMGGGGGVVSRPRCPHHVPTASSCPQA